MDRSQKAAWVSSLKQVFDETTLVVVTHYSGLTVAEITELRSQLRVAGASFKVTKYRLTKLALAGTGFEGLDDLFNGPTAIAYSHDPVAAAKVAVGAACVTEMMTIAPCTGHRLIMILIGVLALQIIFTTVQRLFF